MQIINFKNVKDNGSGLFKELREYLALELEAEESHENRL
jgi:hypothetical protein